MQQRIIIEATTVWHAARMEFHGLMSIAQHHNYSCYVSPARHCSGKTLPKNRPSDRLVGFQDRISFPDTRSGTTCFLCFLLSIISGSALCNMLQGPRPGRIQNAFNNGRTHNAGTSKMSDFERDCPRQCPLVVLNTRGSE